MDLIQKRFDELTEMAEAIKASQEIKPTQRRGRIQPLYGPTQYEPVTIQTLDSELLTEWQTSVRSHLSRVFGEDTPTYKAFDLEASKSAMNMHALFAKQYGIFRSAKSDYEGGYLFTVRNLVHADLTTDELEQAKLFLDAGQKVAAAVIAGTVLETSLRELCSQRGIDLADRPKAQKMNDDLAKAGVYNKMRHDQIAAWMKIRNDAAHGQSDEFESGEVNRMIDGIREFVASHMS